MPRVSRMRITGAKYDNFRKGYEDEMFDLTGNDKPDHTLFTLVNQGGKGVLMQLLSQITMPDTRWGRESGNRIISMFYDRHKNFRPYTFHVIMEWKLDTVPEKWLIAGVCVTAEKKYTSDEQDDRTGLNYFHYTVEHDNSGFFTVENMPIYDLKNKKPVDYDDYERFINDNGKYIIKYPMSQTRRLNSPYYEYLKNRGIHRTEWEVMKVINRSEGGVSSYFSSASDNKSVIDKMIIPAITQNMGNYSDNAGESLKEMFISNLSITRDLPHLLERENDYRELLILLAPLTECAGEGYETQKKFKKYILEGNNILATLNNMRDRAYDKKKNWEDQLKTANEELEHHNFENENMEYANYKKQQVERKGNLNRVEYDIKELGKQVQIKKDLKREIEIGILLKDRNVLINERKVQIDKKQYLIESMEIEDLKKEMKRMEDIIFEKWDRSRDFFEQISANHNSYQKHLEKVNEKLEESRKREDKQLADIRADIAVFDDRKIRHKERFNKLTEYFDTFSLAVPEYLLNEIKEQAEKRKVEISGLDALISEAEELLYNTRQGKYKKEIDKDKMVEDLEKAEKQYEKAREYEEKIKNMICQAEGLEPISVVYTHTWAKNRIKNIESLINSGKERLDGLKTRMWEVNVDMEVNNKEFWVPNSDIVSLKQAIEAIGVGTVQSGTEFLYGVNSEEEKKELIKSNPLLPYGIVIPSEKEWELIEKNIGESMFLRAAVPIFVRKNMNDTIIKSIINTGHNMVADTNEYIKWYSGLGEKISALKQSIAAVDKSFEWLIGIKKDIKNIVMQRESNDILKQLKEIKQQISNLENDISLLDTKINKIDEELQKHRKQRDNLKAEEVRDNERISRLEAYVEENNIIKDMQQSIDSKILAKQEIEKNIKDIDSKKSKILNHITEDRGNYEGWKAKLNERMKNLKNIIPETFLRFNIEGKECDYAPDYSIEGVENIFADVDKRLDLDREVQARNMQVMVLDEKIDGLNENIMQNENKLNNIVENWRESEVPVKSEAHLKNLLTEVINEINDIDRNVNDKRIILNELTGGLNQLENSISNVRRRLSNKYNRQAQQWEGIDLEGKEFEIRQSIARCTKRIESIKIYIDEADKKYNDINLSLSGLRKYEELDISRGTVDEALSVKLEKDARKQVDIWQDNHRDLRRRLSDTERKMRSLLDVFRNEIKSGLKEKILLEKLLTEIQNINTENFKLNLDAFVSMKSHFQKELETTSSDKKKAEQVREQWAQRAAKHIIRIIDLMKEMVHGMVYINNNQHAFPLIKLKGEEMMPSKEDEVLVLLKEHFIFSINKTIEKNIQPEDIDKKILDELMGDQVLFSRALRGRYPVLMVYKMTERNEFKYARPHDHYYASWEAVNRGEEGSAEGSGGQRVSICTFMMMMLVNFKKLSSARNPQWTVLLMDNPFGQASAKHILDPIFEIADSLNFQIISFAPPEIIKIDISKRFPVFWELRIEGSSESNMDVITSRLVHGGRTILHEA